MMFSEDPAEGSVDVVVVGAGILGLYQLHLARQAGYSVRLLEQGYGVGGTWYWNRYPGCRSDSASYAYGYLFSGDLRQEWDWSEEFAAQPETERYLNYVADKLDLRRHIRLGTKVTFAAWDEASASWTTRTAGGFEVRSRFLISATGALSVPRYPDVPGRQDFAGEAYHPGRWPREPVNFTGKRTAIVGTGSSGVQIAVAIRDDAESVTIYQRTPCAILQEKIRGIAADPGTADRLSKRNVALVSLRETPILRVTPTGIETSDRHREFDIIVWATGFDCGTGALLRMGITGVNGLTLDQYWADGPSAYLGLMCHGFPNLFFPGGPHGASGSSPRYGGEQVDFIQMLISYARDHGCRRVEVPVEAEEASMTMEAAIASDFKGFLR